MKIARLNLSVALVVAMSAASAQAGKPALRSGLQPGKTVPSFYTRAVTGPLANKSVCYVCRNGARPVVMLLMRKIGPEMKPLLTGIDKIVDKNRANGLRGFGVLINDNSRKATSAVQTFAFNNRLQLPLTVAGEVLAGKGGHNLHKDAALTVVLYRKQKVVKSWTFRDGELKEEDVKAIGKRLREFIEKK